MPPAYYTFVPVVFRTSEDVLSNEKYDGDTAFLLVNVPQRTKDDTEEVTPDMIKEYMYVAINEVDPIAKAISGMVDS